MRFESGDGARQRVDGQRAVRVKRWPEAKRRVDHGGRPQGDVSHKSILKQLVPEYVPFVD
jgi:hypothetical protein